MSALRAFVATILIVLATPAALAHPGTVSRYVAGYDDVPIAVTETGPADGPEILFLHGIGHAKESFAPQFVQSAMPQTYRMVAYDLRGHGQSGKPWREEDYADPAIWAEDARAVMDATGLERPVIVAWSYGTFVAADMLRELGSERIAGIVMVNATGGMVAIPPAPEAEMPADYARAFGLIGIPSHDAQREAVGLIGRYLVTGDKAPEWRASTQVSGMMMSPYVRPVLRAKRTDNVDLAATNDVPILLLQGEFDFSMTGAIARDFVASVANSSGAVIAGVGHSPFAEDPETFNRIVAAFVARHWQRPAD